MRYPRLLIIINKTIKMEVPATNSLKKATQEQANGPRRVDQDGYTQTDLRGEEVENSSNTQTTALKTKNRVK